VHFKPVLLDETEIPDGGELRFTWARVPYTYRRGDATRLRVLRDHGWQDCADLSFDPTGVREVEAEIKFSN
jgi:hypothetical protein